MPEIIARSELPSGYLVSTVRLGDGRYETMVFAETVENTERHNVSSSAHEVWSNRTESEAFARQNHNLAVRMFKRDTK